MPGYSATQNQFTSLPSGTPTYDANGNLLTDNLNTYTWDPNWGNMLSVKNGATTVTATYDARGQVVEQYNGTAYAEILYSPIGKTAIMNGTAFDKGICPPSGRGDSRLQFLRLGVLSACGLAGKFAAGIDAIAGAVFELGVCAVWRAVRQVVVHGGCVVYGTERGHGE